MIMDCETGHKRLAMAMSDGESRDALTLRELQLRITNLMKVRY